MQASDGCETREGQVQCRRTVHGHGSWGTRDFTDDTTVEIQTRAKHAFAFTNERIAPHDVNVATSNRPDPIQTVRMLR